MTTSRNGKRAASIHPQNALSINPALLWLASLTPAGRRGMQSLLRRCAGILRPGAKPDTYPWHTLDYTSVMRVRSVLLDEGYAVATVNIALSALKSVAGAAFSMGILDADRLTRIRSVRRVTGSATRLGRALDRTEIRAMLAAAGKADAVRCQRNRAILLLLCGAGLRAAELVALDVGDIDVATGIVIVRQGKGRKIREIHLSGKVCMQLR